MDRSEDRRRRLERVAHQDQHALTTTELEATQRGRGLRDDARELVERPRPVALAQGSTRPRAVRDGPVDQPCRKVPDHKTCRVIVSEVEGREQKEVVDSWADANRRWRHARKGPPGPYRDGHAAD